MRILMIEDDQEVRDYTRGALEEANHTVDTADNGEDGLHMASNENYDVLIVDRMLPKMDGLTIIKSLRGSGNTTPALVLSALGEVDDKVKGLRAGSDDYLVKPFAFAELLARVESLGKRNALQTVDGEALTLHAGDLKMDLLSRKVTRGDKKIDIQAREFKLLEYLLRNKGQIVTRTMLLENVWEYHFDPQTNVIDVHISRLRSKLNEGFDDQMIKTVRGAGYIIEDD